MIAKDRATAPPGISLPEMVVADEVLVKRSIAYCNLIVAQENVTGNVCCIQFLTEPIIYAEVQLSVTE